MRLLIVEDEADLRESLTKAMIVLNRVAFRKQIPISNMFTISDTKMAHNCAGFSRRDFLSIGSLGIRPRNGNIERSVCVLQLRVAVWMVAHGAAGSSPRNTRRVG